LSVVKQYFRYALVGTFMAIASVVGRELLALLLPDTHLNYLMTILVVYGLGTFVAFRLQESFTFSRVPASNRRTGVFGFYVVAVLVGFLTAALAYLFRYELGFEKTFAPRGAAASYAASTLITSVASYGLSARFVFPRQ
jgi:hypothetical protein